MKVSKKLLLLLSCLILLLSLSPVREAQAQETGPSVYFSPNPSYIYINGTNEVTVDIMVRDAVEIRGFHFRVYFDPSVVTLESYEFGDFLANVNCSNQAIYADHLWLVCAQTGPQHLPKSGDGSLVRLVFSGASEGASPLTFGYAEFSNKGYQSVFPVKINGTLNVVDPNEFQYLPMIMNVSIQGVVNRGGIGVSLARGLNNGMGPYSGTSTNISGNNLTITNVVADSYRISTNHPRVLNISPEMNKIFTLASGANQVPALNLVAGNADWSDNEINIDDWTVICGAWGDASLNPNADVNFDGAVDARDLAFVAANWELTSETAYAAWLP